MGTSVATELMARDLRGELDFELTGALLFNGSMLLHLARPTIGQKLLRSRLGPLFLALDDRAGLPRPVLACLLPEHPLSDEEAADQWSLIAHDDGAAHRPPARSTTWPSANASPSAGTARSATGPGR